MAFDPQALDEIRSRLKVSDVVGSHMVLVKKGSEYVAKDNESFTVNDTKGIWTEFGSGGDGKGHDIFDFMQTYAGLSFVEAVKELARQAGVDVESNKDGARRAAPAPDRARSAQQPRARANGVRSNSAAATRGDRAEGSVGDAAEDADRVPARAAAAGKREIVKEWDYRDAENNLLYQVVRMQERMPDGEWRLTREGKIWKTFIQRRPDGNGNWIMSLDVVDADGKPIEFVKPANRNIWLKADEERLKWKNITRGEFPQLGNVEHWLYNANAVIDELQEPKDEQRPIFLPEGEAKVDVLTEWGLLAVTNSGGAKHFTEACAKFFHAARQVVVLQDNDRPGMERAAKIAAMLKAAGVELVQTLNFRDVWRECPIKGDVKDWRDKAGGTKAQLLEIVDDLKPWAPEPYKSKFGAKTAFDLNAPARAYPWRIKGILPMYDNSLIMGPSRSGKTFECLDMLMHVHNGEPFAGRKVVPGGTIYLTYEGATGFENRLRAYLKHYGMTVADLHSFAWITRPPNLYATEDNVKALAAEVLKIAEGFTLPLACIVVDTHNAATRGSSEIKSEDINRIMDNYEALRVLTGVPIILIGHTNAEGKHRGNEQLFNNIETAIRIERVYTDTKKTIEKRDDNGRVVRRGVMAKQREGDDRIQWEFVLEPVVIGTDEDNDNITSMVSVEPAQHVPDSVTGEHDGSRPRPEGFYLRGNNVDVFGALLRALEKEGKPPPPELNLSPGIARVIKWSELGIEYKKTDPREQDEDLGKYSNRIKARTKRFREDLLKYNVIGIAELPLPPEEGEKPKSTWYVWPTGKRVYGKGLQWPPAPKKKPEQKPILAPGEREGDIPGTVF